VLHRCQRVGGSILDCLLQDVIEEPFNREARKNFGYVTTVPPRSSHCQDGFLIENWKTHHGSRINHAQRQLKIREAVTPRADSVHSCAVLRANLPAFLATLLKTSDLRIVDHTHVATGHGLGVGELAIAAQSQKATWFVGRRSLFWHLDLRLLAMDRHVGH
jgi:hypothetical protein